MNLLRRETFAISLNIQLLVIEFGRGINLDYINRSSSSACGHVSRPRRNFFSGATLPAPLLLLLYFNPSLPPRRNKILSTGLAAAQRSYAACSYLPHETRPMILRCASQGASPARMARLKYQLKHTFEEKRLGYSDGDRVPCTTYCRRFV